MTLKTNKLRDAIAFAIVAGVAATAGTGVAFAQQSSGQQSSELDRITVTGSRIRQAETETAQPVAVIDRQDIERQGFTSVADILQNLTSAGSPAISRADALESGENVGGYYIDIRNLGATRTLVLVNGKRLGVTTSGLQDLSQIPVSAIERMEVLKDGASAIYGSDAIAGVVNIITRTRFEGVEANAYYGQFSDGDGGIQTYSFTTGFTNERGGTTLSVEYSKENPVLAGDRWFSRFGNAGPDYPGSGFSAVSQNGSWFNGTTWVTLREGGDPLNPADYVPHTAEYNANSNLQMLLRTGVERRGIFASTSYDITDRVTAEADVLYNQRITDQMVAGYPYQSLAFDTPLSGDSAFNPVGEDIEFRRRLWEVPRTTRSRLDSFRIAGALKGYFEVGDNPWDWEVGVMVNRNNLNKTGHGDMSLLASRQALGPSFVDANGVVRCGTADAPIAGCVPWNPLLPNGVSGQGSLSDADLQNFLFPYYTDTGTTKTTNFYGSLSGTVVELPAGPLGFAVGIERRKEQGRFVPDAFAQSGEYTGLPADTTEGSYELNEAFAELSIPLLADVAFAKELTLNLASRYSDYSNFGDTTNSKFGFTWRPMDDLLVRATWAEGFRAPSIANLYGGTGGTFSFYTDPCGTGAVNSVNGNAACNADGVPVGYVQLGQGLVPCTAYPCQTPDQFLSGSNPNLKPETSRSATAGLVWSPRWVEGLDVTLDWWRYRLENMIISDSVNRILRDCYVLGDRSRCEQAGVTRAADGHITSLFFGLANLGRMETEGWDLGLRYRLPETSVGQFSIDWQNSYTSKYDTAAQNSDGEDIMVGGVGSPGIFRLRSNLGVNWSMGDFGVSYMARYYSGMNESCVTNRPCNDPDRYANGEPDALRRTGSNTFHDVQFSWAAPWNATIAVGANNVTNHYGPIMFTSPNSQYPYYGGFDIGRFIYMKYQQRF